MSIVYVGNRRGRPSSWDTPAPPDLGIAIFDYDDAQGSLRYRKTVAQDISVGATWIDRRRNVLYCVHETMTPAGYHKGGGGQVCAFAIDPASGDLSEINRVPSLGSLPAYVTVDVSGRYLLACNHTGHTPITRAVRDAAGDFRVQLQYDDATTVVYRLEENGAVGPACDVVWHQGAGGPLPLQSHSQLHSIEMSPRGDLFVVCDKGSDEIALFQLDRERGALLPCPGSPLKAPAGSSPRYSAFHPSLPCFYVNHETQPLIAVYRYQAEGGARPVMTLDISAGSPAGVKLMQSDLRMHPKGHVLYGLVRGSNEVKVMAVSQTTGTIELIQSAALDGEGPRGCAISPDGRFLLVAALGTKDVQVWRIAMDGTLWPTAGKASLPYPGNIAFY